MEVVLTKKEREVFEALSEKEKIDFIEQASKTRQSLLLKTLVMSAILMECFDELEQYNMHRQKLKQIGKNYNNHLEVFINEIYDIGGADKENSTYIFAMIETINKKIDKLF